MRLSICLYVVPSKYSPNHILSEKYEAVQSHELHFLQNSPLVQLRSSASDCKVVEILSRSHFVKPFSALPSHS